MANYRSDIRDYNTPREMSVRLLTCSALILQMALFTTNDRIKFHCQYLEIHKRVQEIWFELFWSWKPKLYGQLIGKLFHTRFP